MSEAKLIKAEWQTGEDTEIAIDGRGHNGGLMPLIRAMEILSTSLSDDERLQLIEYMEHFSNPMA